MSKYENRKDSRTGISRMVNSSSGNTIAEDLKNKSVRKRGFVPVRSYIRTAKSTARSVVSSEPVKDAAFQAYFSKFCRPLNNGVEYRIGDAIRKMGAGAKKIRLVKEASKKDTNFNIGDYKTELVLGTAGGALAGNALIKGKANVKGLEAGSKAVTVVHNQIKKVLDSIKGTPEALHSKAQKAAVQLTRNKAWPQAAFQLGGGHTYQKVLRKKPHYVAGGAVLGAALTAGTMAASHSSKKNNKPEAAAMWKNRRKG